MFLESFVNIGHKGIVYVTLRVLYESERLCSRMCERKKYYEAESGFAFVFHPNK